MNKEINLCRKCHDLYNDSYEMKLYGGGKEIRAKKCDNCKARSAVMYVITEKRLKINA